MKYLLIMYTFCIPVVDVWVSWVGYIAASSLSLVASRKEVSRRQNFQGDARQLRFSLELWPLKLLIYLESNTRTAHNVKLLWHKSPQRGCGNEWLVFQSACSKRDYSISTLGREIVCCAGTRKCPAISILIKEQSTQEPQRCHGSRSHHYRPPTHPPVLQCAPLTLTTYVN